MGPADMPRHVLMEYPGPAHSEGAAVYGASVASEAFVSALLKHGTWERYEFVTSDLGEALDPHCLIDRRPGVAVTPLRELQRRGAELQAPVWHVTSPNPGVASYFRARWTARPFPVSMVSHSFSYQEFLHSRFLPLLLDALLSCDSIICTSRAAQRSFQSIVDRVASRFNDAYGSTLSYPGRYDVIPLGVDTDQLFPRPQEAARKAIALPAEPIILLWLGRVSAIDKADLAPLVSALADVSRYIDAMPRPEPRSLMLVIAGSDPHGHAAALEGFAQALGVGAQVRVITELDDMDKGALYAAADMFVAPIDNLQESFGLAPIEAMACGLPQVGAAWNGYRDTISDGETGFLVPTLWMDCDADLRTDASTWRNLADHAALAQSVAVDPDALRGAIMQLALNDELRQRMGDASRRRAVRCFAWTEVIRQYERLWADLRERARSLPGSPAGGPDYREPAYFEAFAHYASQILRDDRTLVLTHAGQALRDGHLPPVPTFDSQGPAVTAKALRVLEAPMSVADLLTHLLASAGLSESSARRELMRLIKHGYVRPS